MFLSSSFYHYSSYLLFLFSVLFFLSLLFFSSFTFFYSFLSSSHHHSFSLYHSSFLINSSSLFHYSALLFSSLYLSSSLFLTFSLLLSASIFLFTPPFNSSSLSSSGILHTSRLPKDGSLDTVAKQFPIILFIILRSVRFSSVRFGLVPDHCCCLGLHFHVCHRLIMRHSRAFWPKN